MTLCSMVQDSHGLILYSVSSEQRSSLQPNSPKHWRTYRIVRVSQTFRLLSWCIYNHHNRLNVSVRQCTPGHSTLSNPKPSLFLAESQEWSCCTFQQDLRIKTLHWLRTYYASRDQITVGNICTLYMYIIRTHLQLYMYIHRHCIQAYPNTEDRAGKSWWSTQEFGEILVF